MSNVKEEAMLAYYRPLRQFFSGTPAIECYVLIDSLWMGSHQF